MRTTEAECRRIGQLIGEPLNRCDGVVRFLIPEGGVSALDAPGQAFHDPEADADIIVARIYGPHHGRSDWLERDTTLILENYPGTPGFRGVSSLGPAHQECSR